MTTIFFRTLIIYGVLIVSLRLMGKRQIGELEVSELVTTLLISEIAALPIESPDIPILYAVVPIVTLLFMEIVSSALLIRFPALKGLFTSRPSVIVHNGRPIERELRRMRISLEELISALRQKEISDISEVDYAILEPNGQISVFKKRCCEPPDAETLGISPDEPGITRILIADGRILRRTVKNLPNGEALLRRALDEAGCRAKEVLLLLADDLGTVRLIRKASPHKQKAKGKAVPRP